MNFTSQVSRLLDDEHRASLELLGRIEQACSRLPRGATAPDATLASLLDAFGRHVGGEVDRHFRFEEDQLFPRLADIGGADIAALLAEEHEAMRELAAELLPLVRASAAGTLDATGFDALRRGIFEMVERQVAHIQKETMALLPMLDQLLDEEADRELAFAHAG
jgi:hemerythrin-like domain-containing protein